MHQIKSIICAINTAFPRPISRVWRLPALNKRYDFHLTRALFPRGVFLPFSGAMAPRAHHNGAKSAIATPDGRRARNAFFHPSLDEKTAGQPCFTTKSPAGRRTSMCAIKNAQDTSTQRYFISRYSSIPKRDPSRPKPDCFTPPNGATSLEIRPVLIPTMPYSSASGTFHWRTASRV